MGRKPNDGKGRMGGRQKGTPNKTPEFKIFLKKHSMTYFTEESVMELDKDGNATGRMITQYEADCQHMKPSDRVNAELTLLKYHTPQMQATSVDMSVADSNKTLADRLAMLSEGEEIPSDTE